MLRAQTPPRRILVGLPRLLSISALVRVIPFVTSYKSHIACKQYELAQEDVSTETLLSNNAWPRETSLADVAGTQEPEYGPDAIQPVTKQTDKTLYTEISPKQLKWQAKEYTCVETQIFYFMTDEGYTCLAQIIYNNVMLVGRFLSYTVHCSDLF